MRHGIVKAPLTALELAVYMTEQVGKGRHSQYRLTNVQEAAERRGYAISYAQAERFNVLPSRNAGWSAFCGRTGIFAELAEKQAYDHVNAYYANQCQSS